MDILKTLLVISLMIGGVFLFVALPVVPPWLAISLSIGFIGYLAAVVLVFSGKRIGYWIGLVLAITVLAVSLPAPAHLFFITSGRIVESTIFIAGNIIQIIYIAAFIQNILLRKRLSRHP
ncbi:MAG: hypothetical protein QXF45_06145 [Candidatus Caldarchaeum sp.]